MNIGKSRKTSDLAALDGATFGLDKAMTLVSFVLLFVIVFIPIFMIVYNAFFFEGKFDIEMFQTPFLQPVLFKAVRAAEIAVIGRHDDQSHTAAALNGLEDA